MVEAATFFDSLPDNAGRCNATSRHVAETIEDGRRAVSSFLNAPAGVVAGRESATSMIFALLEAVTDGAKTGNVVCGDFDHAATVDASAYVCTARGLEHRVARLDRASGIVSSVLQQVKRGHIVGQTDELGYHAVEDPVHVHDRQATILHCLGIDHRKFT